MKGLNVKKVQEMFKRWRFRLSDIEYGVDVVYTGCILEGYLWWRENMCVVIMMY